ncbi:MAG: SurA N-terminal domain-containing protein [Sedimenticola sp.]|nr:SurA N-terminal domain-containing protein [Sedimenticola sp.]
MLQSIRERAQGVVAWFIVILISIPFALFGINSYLGGGSETVAATVNGQEITQSEFEKGYRDFRQSLRQRLGENYRPEMIDEAKLRQEVLQLMIRNNLLTQKSEAMGLRVADELVRQVIASIPSFQAGGSFNQDAYERGVRLQGLTPAGFEEQMRRGMVSEQLSKAVTVSEFTTASELESLVRLRMQQRTFSHLVIPAARLLEGIEVPEQAIVAEYEANPDRFMAPERVKIEYLDLDLNGIAASLQADEETLRAYYNEHEDQYKTREQRRASHILIPVDEGSPEADVEQARAQIEDALQRVRSGEPFAGVAKELSQDPGSAEEGGDLGFFESGIMDPAFEEAVFGLAVGEISEPVRTPFGFHIIKLTEVREPAGKSFQEAREDVQEAYLRGEAGRLFYEYAEQLANITYEEPGSLQPAAEALGLEVKTSGWITREGGEGILAAPKVVGAAFSEDVMIAGNNSEAIELDPEHVMVLRVVDHEERTIKSLDAVREPIRDRLRVERAMEKAQQRGEELVTRLEEGLALDALAGELGLEVVPEKQVGRDEREYPADLIEHLFTMPRPVDDGKNYSFLALASGDLAIVSLSEVVDGTMADANEVGGEAALKDAMHRSRGKSYFQHLQANLYSQAEIEIPAESASE